MINHKLNMAGLASLEDPRALLSQVAMGIKDHDKFRAVLLKCEPEERQNCYSALRSRLPFEPKPLETYIMEGKQEAERQKLPVFADGKLMNFEDYNPTRKSLHELAEKAIADRMHADEAKGSLELVCRKCTVSNIIAAKDRKTAYSLAKSQGWTFEMFNEIERALCKKCSPRLT